MKKKLYDFYYGLIAPTRSSILLILTLVFLFFTILTGISEHTFSRFFYFYPGINYVDETSYVYLNAVRSEENNHSSYYDIFLVGASTFRETFLHEEYMQKTLEINYNVLANVTDLTSTAQPWWLSRDLIDNFACGKNGVVVLASNIGRWGRFPFIYNNNFFTLPNRNENNFIHKQLENIKFRYQFTKNIFNFLMKKKGLQIDKFHHRHRYIKKSQSINTIDRIQRNLKWSEFIIKNYEVNKTDIHNFLIELVLNLQKCSKMKIILLGTPINPEILDIPGMSDLMSAHKNMMRNIASDLNIVWYDFNDLDFNPANFYDHGHLHDYFAISRSSEYLTNIIGNTIIEGE